MHPIPSNKIQLRDIKDHADLMDAFEHLIILVSKRDWRVGEITQLKSEIAHFLRAQSAAVGVAAECNDGPFDKSDAVPDNNVRKHSNNPNL
jgi:hypothetical protein